MQISGAGAFTGNGSFSPETFSLVPHTISFTIYNNNLPATMTGDAPSISDKIVGSIFALPSQGNMTRTETSLYWNGSSMQTIYHNINLHAWTDGTSIYFPGDTYIMPNTNVTFTAIWQTLYAPTISDSQPYSVSYGDTVTITGSNLGSTSVVTFDRFYDSPSVTVVNDTTVLAVVPEGAQGNQDNPGVIDLTLISGATGFIYDAYEIV